MYEYKVVKFKLTSGFWSYNMNEDDLEKVINEWAEKGWKLVNSFPVTESYGGTRFITLILRKKK